MICRKSITFFVFPHFLLFFYLRKKSKQEQKTETEQEPVVDRKSGFRESSLVFFVVFDLSFGLNPVATFVFTMRKMLLSIF